MWVFIVIIIHIAGSVKKLDLPIAALTGAALFPRSGDIVEPQAALFAGPVK